jgi:hypothetical protein
LPAFRERGFSSRLAYRHIRSLLIERQDERFHRDVLAAHPAQVLEALPEEIGVGFQHAMGPLDSWQELALSDKVNPEQCP